MFDARLRPLIDPMLNRIGQVLAGAGITANGLTFTGLALGFGGAVAIALGHLGWGLALICANRLLDGLDGAVARVRGHQTSVVISTLSPTLPSMSAFR